MDAKRPNNKGNGLSAKKAKKTIQAAINIAKKGDTILVLPGTYAPIETKNKKITVKSTKGRNKTQILGKDESYWSGSIAELGAWKLTSHEWISTYGTTGEWKKIKVPRYEPRGTASALSGFRLKGRIVNDNESWFRCVAGGTVRHCVLEGVAIPKNDRGWVFACETAAKNSRLEDCVIENIYCTTSWSLLSGCTLVRCKVRRNNYDLGGLGGGRDEHLPMVDSTKCYSCLFADNSVTGPEIFRGSSLVNCTVADNLACTSTFNEGSTPPTPVLSTKSKYYNCVLWNNHSQRGWRTWTTDDSYPSGRYVTHTEPKTLHNADTGNTYRNTDKTNRDPKFATGYKLKKGSYCIDSGKLTESQKKLVGTKDLAGRKRIRGKAIDRGCYEY